MGHDNLCCYLHQWAIIEAELIVQTTGKLEKGLWLLKLDKWNTALNLHGMAMILPVLRMQDMICGMYRWPKAKELKVVER